jgi:dUTP pyrophosphatase
MNILKWKFIDEEKAGVGLSMPATAGSAGIDLPVAETITLKQNVATRIATNIAVEIPSGYVGLIFARSSMLMKGVIVYNGVIDSDYRGELKIQAESRFDVLVEKDQTIAQLLIVPCNCFTPLKVCDLQTTKRGADGFGSTDFKKQNDCEYNEEIKRQDYVSFVKEFCDKRGWKQPEYEYEEEIEDGMCRFICIGKIQSLTFRSEWCIRKAVAKQSCAKHMQRYLDTL